MARLGRLYVQILYRPLAAFKALRRNPPALAALGVYLAVQAGSIAFRGDAVLRDASPVGRAVPWLAGLYGRVLVLWCVSVAFAAFVAGVVHALARIFDGKAAFPSYWTATLLVFSWGSLAGWLPWQAAAIVVALWAFAMDVAAIRAIYGFGWGKSAGLGFISLVIVMAGAAILPVLAAVLFAAAR